MLVSRKTLAKECKISNKNHQETQYNKEFVKVNWKVKINLEQGTKVQRWSRSIV